MTASDAASRVTGAQDIIATVKSRLLASGLAVDRKLPRQFVVKNCMLSSSSRRDHKRKKSVIGGGLGAAGVSMSNTAPNTAGTWNSARSHDGKLHSIQSARGPPLPSSASRPESCRRKSWSARQATSAGTPDGSVNADPSQQQQHGGECSPRSPIGSDTVRSPCLGGSGVGTRNALDTGLWTRVFGHRILTAYPSPQGRQPRLPRGNGSFARGKRCVLTRASWVPDRHRTALLPAIREQRAHLQRGAPFGTTRNLHGLVGAAAQREAVAAPQEAVESARRHSSRVHQQQLQTPRKTL